MLTPSANRPSPAIRKNPVETQQEGALRVDRHGGGCRRRAQLAGQHLHQRIEQRGCHGQEHHDPRDLRIGVPRLLHHQHAEEANDHRAEPQRPDLFAENRDRQESDEQRRHEEERGRLAQRQHGHRGVEGHVRHDHEEAAQGVDARRPAAEEPEPAFPEHEAEGEAKPDGGAGEDHLVQRVSARQPLDEQVIYRDRQYAEADEHYSEGGVVEAVLHALPIRQGAAPVLSESDMNRQYARLHNCNPNRRV